MKMYYVMLYALTLTIASGCQQSTSTGHGTDLQQKASPLTLRPFTGFSSDVIVPVNGCLVRVFQTGVTVERARSVEYRLRAIQDGKSIDLASGTLLPIETELYPLDGIFYFAVTSSGGENVCVSYQVSGAGVSLETCRHHSPSILYDIPGHSHRLSSVLELTQSMLVASGEEQVTYAMCFLPHTPKHEGSPGPKSIDEILQEGALLNTLDYHEAVKASIDNKGAIIIMSSIKIK